MIEIAFSFSRHAARIALHVQFLTDTLEKVPAEKAEELGFAEPRANFATHANLEIARFKFDAAYIDTPDVVQTDTNRDDSVLFNRSIAKSYASYCTDPDLRAAGKVVFDLFEKTGDIDRLPYAEETSTITQLTNKLREEPYVSALAKIGLENAPDEMDAFNKEFNDIYFKRSTENRDRAYATPTKTLRQNSDAAFDELAKAINAMYVVNELVTKDESKREALKQIIDDVNALIVRFQMNMNGSASTDKEETPEDPSTETPDEENPGTEEPENPDGGGGGDEENPSGPGIPNP